MPRFSRHSFSVYRRICARGHQDDRIFVNPREVDQSPMDASVHLSLIHSYAHPYEIAEFSINRLPRSIGSLKRLPLALESLPERRSSTARPRVGGLEGRWYVEGSTQTCCPEGSATPAVASAQGRRLLTVPLNERSPPTRRRPVAATPRWRRSKLECGKA